MSKERMQIAFFSENIAFQAQRLFHTYIKELKNATFILHFWTFLYFKVIVTKEYG